MITPAIARDLWLLRGDLDSIEAAIAWYIQTWGQHLPGVHPEHTAGVPVATANMAMTVIRKNVRRIPEGGGYHLAAEADGFIDAAVMDMLAADRDEAEQRAWEAEQEVERLTEMLQQIEGECRSTVTTFTTARIVALIRSHFANADNDLRGSATSPPSAATAPENGVAE